MPHKRNPVTSEQICGLARVVRAQRRRPAMENIALWHERDISHSSVERVILADSAILTDYMLAKTAWLIDGMRVYPERMRRNLESTNGLIFSGQLLLDLRLRECCAKRRIACPDTCHGRLGNRGRFSRCHRIGRRNPFLSIG